MCRRIRDFLVNTFTEEPFVFDVDKKRHMNWTRVGIVAGWTWLGGFMLGMSGWIIYKIMQYPMIEILKAFGGAFIAVGTAIALLYVIGNEW